MKLHLDTLSAPGASPTRALAFLHGILGTGVNLRAVARRVVEARPQWSAVLVDLRAHGQSQGRDGPDTLDAAAKDLLDTFAGLTPPVRGLVGHSFGGKVALRYAQLAPLDELVLVDSAPGLRLDHAGSEATMGVVALLGALPRTWPTRDAFVRAVEAQGQSKGVAQWLAMNLEREGTSFRFVLELERIHALLDSYFQADLWPVVEASARGEGPRVHVVLGERSRVFDHDDRVRVTALESASAGRVSLDLLPAGHWVHVDDFEGLVRTVVARLPV